MTKFASVLKRWEHKELSAQEAGELLGCSERQFRRWRRRYEEEGVGGLADRRLGRASVRRVPVDRIVWMLGEYRTRHAGWSIGRAPPTRSLLGRCVVPFLLGPSGDSRPPDYQACVRHAG